MAEKRHMTEKQKASWEKCTKARRENLEAKRLKKLEQEQRNYIIREVKDSAEEDVIEKRKQANIERVARIWEEVRQERLAQAQEESPK